MPRTSEQRSLLLDTHVWIWLVQRNPTLAADTRDRIRAASHTGLLKIAAITLWEVALLASHRRIELGEKPLA